MLRLPLAGQHLEGARGSTFLISQEFDSRWLDLPALLSWLSLCRLPYCHGSQQKSPLLDSKPFPFLFSEVTSGLSSLDLASSGTGLLNWILLSS